MWLDGKTEKFIFLEEEKKIYLLMLLLLEHIISSMMNKQGRLLVKIRFCIEVISLFLCAGVIFFLVRVRA